MSGGIFHPSIFHPSIFDTGDLAGTTAQSVTATPGKPHWFGAKTEAAGSTPRDDTRFTELSNSALAGKIHSFLAKTEAVLPGTPRGTDRFTQLSTMALPGKQYLFQEEGAEQVTALQVYALPGKRRVFLAKTESGELIKKKFSLHGADQQRHALLLRDDEEILEFIVTITTAGLLEH